MNEFLINPFDNNHFIGYVSFVSPGLVKVHFPSSILLKMFNYGGEQNSPGMVGSYVAIEGDNFGFLGKIMEVSLPEKERLELNENSFHTEEFHPIGQVEILLCFDFYNRQVKKGINQLPTVGAKVFICSGQTFADFFKNVGVKENEKNIPALFNMGKLNLDNVTEVKVSSQSIFARHCAVIGTTGGGKSYTIARIIEEFLNHNGKAILIDASGEYNKFDNNLTIQTSTITLDSFFHFSNLTIGDYFILLRPSAQSQKPKLLEAMKSLKLIRCLDENEMKTVKVDNGVLIKEKMSDAIKNNFKQLCEKYVATIESIDANFDIEKLSSQIEAECINTYGNKDDKTLEFCSSLIIRINGLLSNENFKKVLGFNKDKTDVLELRNQIENFINDPEKKLLRINLEYVYGEFQLREILVNALGKYLLEKARKKSFKEKPLVLFLDEAHQFLNKSVKDEFFDFVSLDSFDLIAKECRKYGLFLVLATQMPRDIPLGTLSQLGTFIVHRLINDRDKEVVANACQEANKSVLSFLPILSEGEAIIMGVDIPMPIIIKINKPAFEPDSETPIAVRN
ncbi:MAG: ATP-binding protein [Bacteroidota bacterium]